MDTRTLTAGETADMGVLADATLTGEANEGVCADTLAESLLLEAGVAAAEWDRNEPLPLFMLEAPVLAFLIPLLLELLLLAWY